MNLFLKLFLVVLLIFSAVLKIPAQEIKTAISTERLINDVFLLASDSLQGREFPSEGKKIAAQYIAQEFEKADLEPINEGEYPYFQKIPVRFQNHGSTRIYVDEESVPRRNNFSFASTGPLSDSLTLKLIFKGTVEPDEITVSGNDIMIHLVEKDIEAAVEKIEVISEKTDIEYFAVTLLSQRKNGRLINAESRALQPQYPESLFGINSGEPDWLYSHLPDTDQTLNVLMIGEGLFEKLYGEKKGLMNINLRRFARNNGAMESTTSELTMALSYEVETKVKHDRNVIGYFEGTDLKDEFVIVCGHYDHLGERGDDIYYGADDNASGTAGVMELARMFSRAREQGATFRRSIVFIAFGAEETGLNGSSYYVANPLFPLGQTNLLINMDMIGRSDVPAGKRGRVYVRAFGDERRQTRRLFRTAGRQIEDIRIRHSQSPLNNLMWRFGSDHFPFVREDVPAVVVTTGTHPDYHTPADTPEKINYPNMTNILKAVFSVIVEIDDR